MAGGKPGIFRRLGRAVKDLVTGHPVKAAREVIPPKPEPPQWPERPEPPRSPILPPPPSGGAPPIFSDHPQYNAASNTWTGRGAPTADQWADIRNRADAITFESAVVFYTTAMDRLGIPRGRLIESANLSYPILERPENKYSDIIAALENGSFTGNGMIRRLESQYAAIDDRYSSLDSGRGHAAWNQRPHNVPESLYWYH
jgi:hypothetical protein